MHDAEPMIRMELDRLSPVADVGRADWANVLGRTASKRSRGAGLLIAAAVVAIAVPTVALSAGVRGLLGFGPRPVLSSAKAVVSAPAGNGFVAHSWRAAATSGGSCFFVTLDHRAAPVRPGVFNGGGACSEHPHQRVDAPTAAAPMTFTLSVTRRLRDGNPANWTPPVVTGSVYGKLHATRVAIEWNGGSHALAFANGTFVGGTPELYMPPFGKFPFAVVAYDARGRVVARHKLDSPTLLLLRGGWKEYAREYHAWQHRKP